MDGSCTRGLVVCKGWGWRRLQTTDKYRTGILSITSVSLDILATHRESIETHQNTHTRAGQTKDTELVGLYTLDKKGSNKPVFCV